MSESKTVNDLTEWNFKVALNFIEKAIENSDWDQAIAKCDQGIQGATDLKNNIWVHKFDNIKQEIIGLKEKEKNMDTIKHKVMIPRLEEKKEGIKMQGTEIIEKVLDAPEQEEMINDDLSIIKGVGSTTEQKLKEAGILSVKQLAGMNPRDLAQINGFGLSSSERIISAAKEYFDQQNESEESLQNKSSPKASMFDQKYSIDRTSRIIPPPKKTSNLSNDIREPPLEDILYSENLEELDDYEEELIEPELVNAKSPQESDAIKGVQKISDESNLNINTNQIEPQTGNNKHVSSYQIPQENHMSKNEIINGFLDDTVEIPQHNTPEIQYEQVMADIRNDFSDEKLNKNTVTSMLKKVQEILHALHYFIIPKPSPIFKKLDRNVDCIAVKVMAGINDTELILITPIKICDLKGTLLISDNGFDYHSEDNPELPEKSKTMLVRSVMKDVIGVQSIIFESVVNDKSVFTFFRKYLKDSNISIEKGRNNQTLFFRSGLLQYKIIINPLVLCHSLPSSLEKSVLFPYQKSTDIHYIDYAMLTSLITFMEHKYQSLEAHCIEGNAVKKYFGAKLTFIKDLRTSSLPFVFFGLIFLFVVLLQGSFLINTFIGLGSAAICVYGVILIYLYLRFAKTKTAISKEFSTPYHQGMISMDDTELFMISKDLSTEQMDQFIYECFGKEADFDVLSKIEEDKYTHSITAQKQRKIYYL